MPGIPAEAFEFYDALSVDNTRSFWDDHRAEYEQHVRQPLAELAAALQPRFGPGKLFRPYRDVRFSRDKRPIKDHQGLYVERRNGLGWYLQVAGAGLMVAGGWYSATPEQVARYRAAVADDETGALAALVEHVAAAGFLVDGERLKTRPRGIEPDHPRLELLRYRTLYASRLWEPAAWMGTRRVVTKVSDAWDELTPLIDWLAGWVGSAEPR